MIDGEIIGPDDAGYERHRRVWNGSIDRRPALIVRCRNADDVTAALRVGRAAELPIAVRGGGHSFPGHSVCDDGLVIDLGPMKRVEVDPSARTVTVEAGALLGDVDAATQAHGLAVPLGSVSHTGVAGLTLGGGFGWLMRRFGLAIDQLTAVDLVTANGDRCRAGEREETDLFWAMRGGGGNFGIATSFTFRLHTVGPEVLSGLMLWPIEEAPDVARFYRSWAADLPDEMTSALLFRRAPAIDIVPEHLHGQHVVGVACCWSGPPDQGVRTLEPLRRFGRAGVDLIEPRTYVEHQQMLDPSFPPGIWIHSKASDVRVLSDAVIDLLVERAAMIRSARSGVIAWQLGGAVSRVAPASTAFGSRGNGYLIDILGATDGPNRFADERDWARNSWEALQPHRSGVYVNWLMEEGAGRIREAYGEAHYRRLRAIKRRYDPDNVFRLNQNIPPG